MKRTITKVLSILLAVVMMLGLMPSLGQVAYAASGSGISESDPRIVTNYDEFKAAMEDSSISVVQLNSVNDGIAVSGTSLIAGATITSNKVLILNGASKFSASVSNGDCVVDAGLSD